jgi:hypothetical protein
LHRVSDGSHPGQTELTDNSSMGSIDISSYLFATDVCAWAGSSLARDGFSTGY